MTVKEVFDRVLSMPPDNSIVVKFETLKRLESFRVQIYREMNNYKRSGGRGALSIQRNAEELSLEIARVPEPVSVFIRDESGKITPLTSDLGTREVIAKMLSEGHSQAAIVSLFPDIAATDLETLLGEIAAIRPDFLTDEEEGDED